MTDLSLWPLVFAAIAHVVIGALWYSPHLFGNAWMRLSNVTPEMAEKGKRRRPFYMIVGFLAAFVCAYVMNYFGMAWNVFDVIGAIELGIWCWVGFVAPAMLGQVLGEMKAFRLYAINSGYWLASFIVMAIILVL